MVEDGGRDGARRNQGGLSGASSPTTPSEGTVPLPPGRTTRAKVAAGALVVSLLVAGCLVWAIAARRAATEYLAAFPGGGCDELITADDIRPPKLTTEATPEDLEDVTVALDRYFAQDRWTYVRTAPDRMGTPMETRISVDGDTLERREADGWTGLARPGAGIARLAGSRFWMPACVNTRQIFDAEALDRAGCIRRERRPEQLVVRWSYPSDDESCADAALSIRVTIADGLPTEWAVDLGGRGSEVTRVVEATGASWPLPIWIAPSWVAPAEAP